MAGVYVCQVPRFMFIKPVAFTALLAALITEWKIKVVPLKSIGRESGFVVQSFQPNVTFQADMTCRVIFLHFSFYRISAREKNKSGCIDV